MLELKSMKALYEKLAFSPFSWVQTFYNQSHPLPKSFFTFAAMDSVFIRTAGADESKYIYKKNKNIAISQLIKNCAKSH